MDKRSQAINAQAQRIADLERELADLRNAVRNYLVGTGVLPLVVLGEDMIDAAKFKDSKDKLATLLPERKDGAR